MGELVSLAVAQRARSATRQRVAEQAFMHPSLRWWAGTDRRKAHRRHFNGTTACGLNGLLVLADAETTLCGVCYPYWSRRRA